MKKKRQKVVEEGGATELLGELEDSNNYYSSYNIESLTSSSSWIQRKSKETEIDVRIIDDEQLSSFASGEASTIAGLGLTSGIGGLPGHSLADPFIMGRHGGGGPDLAPNERGINYGVHPPVDAVSRPGPETTPLPPDASSTLYVEGLPFDSTRREVAHIFRPFVGYREVRLVSKESKHRGGDPLILCFVDFANPACAATALSALQGIISIVTCR